jgi:hypothetical protein
MSQESKKQTAVDWLVSHLNKQEWFTYKQREYIEQAKKMEKQQIIDAYAQGFIESESMDKGAEQYYTETYGKQQNG